MPTPNPAKSQKIIYLTRNRKLLSNFAALPARKINKLSRVKNNLIPMGYALTTSPSRVFRFGFSLKTAGRGQAAASIPPQKIPNIPFKHFYA